MTSLRGGKHGHKAHRDKQITVIEINNSFNNDTLGSGIANGSGGIGNGGGAILASFDNQLGVFVAV